MSELRIVRARGVLGEDGAVLDGGGLRLSDGRVAEVLRRPPSDAEDLGDVLLTPPLVNAHCHLELTCFAGKLPRDQGFGAWVRELMRLRAAATPEELEASARDGAERLLATGCGVVHDIDTTGAAARALLDVPIEAVVHREAIDASDAQRREQCVARLEVPLATRAGLREGLSPHAPYTCSPALLRALGDLARRRGLPMTIHWAETEEEREYLLHGGGPLAELLPPSPRRSGLDLLADAGLLDGDLELSLVHGNHPEPGDYERLARAGATLVHCPGTHAFFDREPFDVEAVRRAGVRLALGTDSAASNDALDLSRELRRFAALPDVAPSEAWRAATADAGLVGARAMTGWAEAEAARGAADLAKGCGVPRWLSLSGDASGRATRYPVEP